MYKCSLSSLKEFKAYNFTIYYKEVANLAKEKKPKTHIEIYVKDKERLEEIRDKEGYSSIAVTLEKELNKKKKGN